MARGTIAGAPQKSELQNDLPHLVDDKNHFISEPIHDCGEFGELAPIGSGWMSKGYHDHRFMVVLQIRLRRDGSDPCDFCAIFYAAPVVVDDVTPIGVWRRNEAHLPLLDIGQDYIEQPVLVRIIEIAEQPKQRRDFCVRSFVRLYRLNCVQKRGAGDEFEAAIPSIRVVQGVTDNGELDRPFLFDRKWLHSLVANGSVKHMVESGPEIMNSISSAKRPPFNGRLVCDVDKDAVAASVNLTFFLGNVRFAVRPFHEFALECVNMLVCTPDFVPATGEYSTDHAVILRG